MYKLFEQKNIESLSKTLSIIDKKKEFPVRKIGENESEIDLAIPNFDASDSHYISYYSYFLANALVLNFEFTLAMHLVIAL